MISQGSRLSSRDWDRQPSGKEPHRGKLILALGIMGLATCSIFAIPAWIMGRRDLKAMREGRMDLEGMAETRAGVNLGMISVALNVVILIAIIPFIIWVINHFDAFLQWMDSTAKAGPAMFLLA